MKCPFCNANMIQTGDVFQCINSGPNRTITNYWLRRGGCPYKNDKLTEAQVKQIEVALIDLEQE